MKSYYRTVLALLIACIVCSESPGLAEEITPYQLAQEYESTSNDSFRISADYIADIDSFTLVMQTPDISPTTWAMCDASIQEQYKSAFSQISVALKDTLDLIGYENTCLVCTLQLSDSSAIFLLVNNNDFSSLL